MTIIGQNIIEYLRYTKQIYFSVAIALTVISCVNKAAKTGNDYTDSSLSVIKAFSDTLQNSVKDTIRADGELIMIANMQSQRAAHTAVLLKDGDVLVCGGFAGTNILSSAEVYNPTSKAFIKINNLNTSRSDHSATLLSNGKVLIAGGYNGNYLSSTELYDPILKTFSAGPTMNAARSGHTATLLNNGKILFTGGVGTSWTFLSSAEIYDTKENKFIPVNSMAVARESHTATLLNNGNVLITGGHRDRRENVKIYSSCEIFDIKTNQFSLTGNMQIARHKHDAVLLADGKVLIIGGSDQRDSRGVYSSAEIFNLNTSQFNSLTASLIYPRYKHKATSVLLPDNNVFIGGGSDQAEIYHFNTGIFISVKGNMGAVRLFSCATLLKDGTVLSTGGYGEDNKSNNEAWLFVKQGR
ncbi:MAG: kelch repeat-containing protein [Ferruginibacter sp.]